MDTINIKAISPVLQEMTNAIVKAVGPDFEEFKNSNKLASMNYLHMLRGDLINDNLQYLHTVLDLRKFKRVAWEGRICIDRENKVTLCIISDRTLKAIMKRAGGNIPHYLRTIVSVENAGMKPRYEQQSLFEGSVDSTPFTEDDFIKDFENIMGEAITAYEGYNHLVISYAASNGMVTSLKAICFTPKLDIADEWNLMDMVNPDSLELTMVAESEGSRPDVHDLVSVKPSIIEAKKQNEGNVPFVSIKKREGKKQG